MKKSTLVIIAIVYVASIIFISFFGMKYKVYNEFFPVTEILILNEKDERTYIGETSAGEMLIATPFTKPANKEDISGTMIQLMWKVVPDNATIKDVQFIYEENPLVEFYETENGEKTGLVLFYGRTNIYVKIMSTDKRRIVTEVVLQAY